jgi:hypothetical protein
VEVFCGAVSLPTINILIGTSAQRKVPNMIGNLEQALLAPTEIIGRAL